MTLLLLGLLLGAEPALDRYGDPLPEGTIARLGTVRFRDESVGEAIAYSPDGTRIATGNSRGVSIWDVRTGQRVRALAWQTPPEASGPFGPIAFAFSSDGKHLAYWAGDDPVLVRALDQDATLRLSQENVQVGSLAFTPDGRHVVAVSPQAVRVLPAVGGPPTQIWPADPDADPEDAPWQGPRFGDAALSPAGKLLAVVGLHVRIRRWRGVPHEPQHVRLYDVATGEELVRLDLPARRVAFRPDGAVLAALVGTEVHLLDPLTGASIGGWEAPQSHGPETLAFSPDGSWLTANGRLYDVATGEALREIELGESLAFSSDGRHLAIVAQRGGAIVVREVLTGRPTVPLAAHNRLIQTAHPLPDGRRVATLAAKALVDYSRITGLPFTDVASDRTIRLWDAATGKPLGQIDYPSDATTFAFAGRWVAYASAGRVEVRDLETGRRAGSADPQGELHQLALSADGRTLLYKWADGPHAQVHDVATGRPRHLLPVSDQGVSALALSPDGSVAAIANAHGRLRLWDTTTGRLRAELVSRQEKSTETRLAFSPDSRLLASCRTVDGDLRLWDTASGRLVRLGPGHGPRPEGEGNVVVWTLTFSADGRLLVTTADDGSVRLWETASLRERFRWNEPTRAVALVGRHLLVTSHDQTDAVVRDLAALADAANVEPRDGKGLWSALAGGDPAKAYRAGRALTATPDAAIALLKDHLRPVAPIEPARLRAWLADLDAEDFDKRERAANELARQGEVAVPALIEARRAATSPEQRRRLDELLASSVNPPHPERLRAVRAIEVLEDIGTSQARAILESVAQGEPDAAETRQAKAALERLRAHR